MYSARQASASRSQSASTPLSAPSRLASAATPERQATVVPKTSKVRARTPLRGRSAPEGGIVFRKVAPDQREVEGGENCVRRLALEKKVEASADQLFHILAFGAGGPALEIGSPDRDSVPGALPGMINRDLAEPILAVGFGVHSDHGKDYPRPMNGMFVAITVMN